MPPVVTVPFIVVFGDVAHPPLHPTRATVECIHKSITYSKKKKNLIFNSVSSKWCDLWIMRVLW